MVLCCGACHHSLHTWHLPTWKGEKQSHSHLDLLCSKFELFLVDFVFIPELFALGSIKSTGQLIYYCRAHTGINTRLTIRTINYHPMTKTKLISLTVNASHPDTRHMRSSHLFSNEYFIVFNLYNNILSFGLWEVTPFPVMGGGSYIRSIPVYWEQRGTYLGGSD